MRAASIRVTPENYPTAFVVAYFPIYSHAVRGVRSTCRISKALIGGLNAYLKIHVKQLSYLRIPFATAGPPTTIATFSLLIGPCDSPKTCFESVGQAGQSFVPRLWHPRRNVHYQNRRFHFHKAWMESVEQHMM